MLCPFTDMFITQGSFTEYSHKGCTAIDVTSGIPGVRAPYYAPCDLKCVNIDHEHAIVWWQSTGPVRLANGSISNVTIMTIHDDSINFGIETIIYQGEQLGNMGTGGLATGVHCHIEVSPTLETGLINNGQIWYWEGKAQNVLMLPNGIEFEDAFFMNGTNIIEGVANWKYYGEESKPKEPQIVTDSKLWARGHVQNDGWQEPRISPNYIGTVGEGKRLEAFLIDTDYDFEIRLHIQNVGWTDWVSAKNNKDHVFGTVGKALRLEAIEIRGRDDVRVQLHIQNIGWVDDLQKLQGTVGLALRVEAIRFVKV